MVKYTQRLIHPNSQYTRTMESEAWSTVQFPTLYKSKNEYCTIKVEANTTVTAPSHGIIVVRKVEKKQHHLEDRLVEGMEQAIKEAQQIWDEQKVEGWHPKKGAEIEYIKTDLIFRDTKKAPLTAGALLAFLQKAVEKYGPDLKLNCNVHPEGNAIFEYVEVVKGSIEFVGDIPIPDH